MLDRPDLFSEALKGSMMPDNFLKFITVQRNNILMFCFCPDRYDLSTANINDTNFDKLKVTPPDVVSVQSLCVCPASVCVCCIGVGT